MRSLESRGFSHWRRCIVVGSLDVAERPLERSPGRVHRVLNRSGPEGGLEGLVEHVDRVGWKRQSDSAPCMNSKHRCHGVNERLRRSSEDNSGGSWAGSRSDGRGLGHEVAD